MVPSASTATATPVPAPPLRRPDPGTDPGDAAGAEQPGARVRQRYFTARAAVSAQDKSVNDLGFVSPDQTLSQSWYEVRASTKQRPARMRASGSTTSLNVTRWSTYGAQTGWARRRRHCTST
jgi:hypothetical protein